MNNFNNTLNLPIDQSDRDLKESLNYQFSSSIVPTSDLSDFQNLPYCFTPIPPSTVLPSTEPWIEAWLHKIGKTVSFKVPYTISKIPLSEARKSLKACLDILNKLAAISADLHNNVEKYTSTEWKKKTIKIGHLKENFTKIMTTFGNAENMSSLVKAVKLRRKKRLNQKKRNAFKQVNKKKLADKNRDINKQIDRWLEVKKEEGDKVKTEETMNKDIDCGLAEVNRMKADAKKNLSLIRALIKLRNVRETMYTQRGEKTSLEDKQAFATTTEKMIKIWENALKNYSNEEHMLKTMLEKTANENLKHKELLKERETLYLWEKVIFGDKISVSHENTPYLALTAAERDLETFIAIRKSWDTFLIAPPSGSSLPIGWVLPPNECSEDWSKFLLNNVA